MVVEGCCGVSGTFAGLHKVLRGRAVIGSARKVLAPRRGGHFSDVNSAGDNLASRTRWAPMCQPWRSRARPPSVVSRLKPIR